MLSDLDIFRAAHFMMHELGGDAELEARRPGRVAYLVQNKAGDCGYASDTPRLATLSGWWDGK